MTTIDPSVFMDCRDEPGNDTGGREWMSKVASASQIKKQLCERLFGGPLIQNNFRGEYIEQVLSDCLSTDWRHCAADWSGWDFERSDGVRLQVKQSAVLQTWGPAKQPGYFSIAPTTGYYANGNEWVAKAGRHAHLYVFAWHDVEDASADQTDSAQWKFFAAREIDLPPRSKGIWIKAIERLSESHCIGTIAEQIDCLADGLCLYLSKDQ